MGIVLAFLVGCSSNEASDIETPTAERSTAASDESQLTAAAADVVGFLRGELPFGELEIAPEVALQLASGGGGTRLEVKGDSLRKLENWHVFSEATGIDYSFLPPENSANLVTREGKHLNCFEYDLSSRADGVAHLPHVGTMLSSGDSCLQSWNVTFLFDPEEEKPTLVGAVYDQWEW